MDTNITHAAPLISKREQFYTAARHTSFCLALILYGVFSSPTPNNPGLIEVIIGGLLLIGIGIHGFSQTLIIQRDTKDPNNGLWNLTGRGALAYGITLPVIIGVSAGNETSLLVRDIIPFGFMFLPLFLTASFNQKETAQKALVLSVITLGALFALRHLIDVFGSGIIPNFGPEKELTYLANAPTTLFAGLFLLGLGFTNFAAANKAQTIGISLIYLLLSLMILATLTITLQRASIGYYVLYAAIIMMLLLYKSPYRALLILLPIIALGVLYSDTIIYVFDSLSRKTMLVGTNKRFDELAAVWNELNNTPLTILFGQGWGATFQSPAVAHIRVNFTHSLLTAMLLKTGVIGVILVFFYIFSLGQRIIYANKHNVLFYIALLGPLIIDTFFYAAYKSLDFGLILLLLSISYKKPLHKIL